MTNWEVESLRVQKILGDLLGQRPAMIVGMDNTTGYEVYAPESDGWITRQIPWEHLPNMDEAKLRIIFKVGARRMPYGCRL